MSSLEETAVRDILTLSVGMSSILEKGGRRVSSYQDLLEDEWEGRQSALNFLREGNHTVDVMLNLNALFREDIRAGIQLEYMALAPVLNGVSGALTQSGRSVACFGNREGTFVAAEVFMLQDAVHGISVYLQDSIGMNNLAIGCLKVSLDANDISLLRSDLEPGDYVAVSIGEKPILELDVEDYTNAVDFKLLENFEDDLARQFIRWIGCMSLHGGELLLNKAGVCGGMLMLLPAANTITDDLYKAKSSEGHTETILLVDDEDMIWDVVITKLNDLGYVVALAADGQEAVEIYKANPGMFDLVLMDMVMPRMNGREAFHQLKEFDSDVKVLLASGYVAEEDVQDVLGAGANAFMRKPYRLIDLAQKIRDILDKE